MTSLSNFLKGLVLHDGTSALERITHSFLISLIITSRQVDFLSPATLIKDHYSAANLQKNDR